MSGNTDADDTIRCELCSAIVPIEDAVNWGEVSVCPKCHAEWKADFDTCAHVWEPAVDLYGDAGWQCLECGGFVATDDQS